MRIEASDLSIELAITGADGAVLGEVPVAFTELIEHVNKIEEDAKAAADQQRDPPYSRLVAFKEWLASKGMPADISDELYGLLLVRTHNQIPHIQKKMLETEHGKPS